MAVPLTRKRATASGPELLRSTESDWLRRQEGDRGGREAGGVGFRKLHSQRQRQIGTHTGKPVSRMNSRSPLDIILLSVSIPLVS